MTDMTRHNFRPSPRNRGSIYAVVMALAILVSLIGLSAVAVGRINLRTASAGGDASTAELLALSAVEHATAVINSNSQWRSTYVNDTETSSMPLGAGSFTWKLQDELDSDLRLSVGGLQPARLFGIGRVGDARRMYSVVLVPTGTNLLSNPGIESGTAGYASDGGNCTLEANGTDVRNGLRSLRVYSRTGAGGGPIQDVTGKITNGKWYYFEAWMKMSTTPEEPAFSILVRKAGNPDQVLKKPIGQTPQPVGTDWTKVCASIYANWSGGADNVYWRVETNTSSQEFKMDDLKLIEAPAAGAPMPMAPARETWRQEAVN